tara:strand:+ start:562 stop:924 length:363 start_codon:yes stop_codon:yes gene_type:complete
MIIQDIKWFCKESNQAFLIVMIHGIPCRIFCDFCDYKVGDVLRDPIFAYGVNCVYKSNKNHTQILSKNLDDEPHQIIAKVLDKQKWLVELDTLIIYLQEYIPGDVDDGEYISFFCKELTV